MGRLWDLYAEWRDTQQFPPSQRQVAAKMGMSATAFGNWRFQLSRLPDAANLVRFADLVRLPYQTVLDAALHDARYLPRPELSSHGAGTGKSEALVVDAAPAEVVPLARVALFQEKHGPRIRVPAFQRDLVATRIEVLLADMDGDVSAAFARIDQSSDPIDIAAASELSMRVLAGHPRLRETLEAARTEGTLSKGQQRLANADRAGEPEADDSSDVEPR